MTIMGHYRLYCRSSRILPKPTRGDLDVKRHLGRAILFAMAVLWSVSIFGCSTSPQVMPTGSDGEQSVEIPVHVTRAQDGRPSKAGSDEKIVQYDLNRDNKPDVWAYLGPMSNPDNPQEITQEGLRHKEWDFNFDGKVDICRYYDFKGGAIRDEMDLDFDGHVDVVTYYLGGKKQRQEYDYNFDNTPDFWKFFEKDKLARTERDRDFNGRIDQWEYYIGGKLDRIGLDEDGDGQIDKWIQQDKAE